MTDAQREESIIVRNNQMVIRNFQTVDRGIVSYFENLTETDDAEQKLEEVLKMGVIALRSVGVAGDVNYVEKAFENLDAKLKGKLDSALEGLDATLKNELDSAFGDDGQFSGLLKSNFGEDGKMIKVLLDPGRKGSPLYKLREDLEKSLGEIRDKMVANRVIQEAAEKSPQKGLNFEDRCEGNLAQIAKFHSDKLDITKNHPGSVPRSRKGDFVVTLGDTGKNIVFEMKAKSLSLNDIQEELREAMKNRDAEYGIFVARDTSMLPEGTGCFNEYDGNQLVCAVENDDGSPIAEGEMILLAYRWARTRLRLEPTETTSLDPGYFTAKAEAIRSKIDDLKKIKTNCSGIEKLTSEIRHSIDDASRKIKQELDDITASLEETRN